MSSPDPVAQLDDDELAAMTDLVPEGETVEAVLRDVQEAVNQLANLNVDVEDPGDLERVRQGLPTEPHRARLVEAALPSPLREAITYVHPSERQSGYWRRVPDLEDPSNLSDAQLRFRHAFMQANVEERGTEGVRLTEDGRAIPATAERTREKLEGESFGDDDVDEGKGYGLLRSILDRL